MTLTRAEILAILSSPKGTFTESGGKRYYTLDESGTLKYNRGTASSAATGKFEGKAGTMHRSRKGAVRRNANGRRYYNGTEVTVVAYMP